MRSRRSCQIDNALLLAATPAPRWLSINGAAYFCSDALHSRISAQLDLCAALAPSEFLGQIRPIVLQRIWPATRVSAVRVSGARITDGRQLARRRRDFYDISRATSDQREEVEARASEGGRGKLRFRDYVQKKEMGGRRADAPGGTIASEGPIVDIIHFVNADIATNKRQKSGKVIRNGGRKELRLRNAAKKRTGA